MGDGCVIARGKQATPPPPVRILGLKALQKGGSLCFLHSCPLLSTRRPVPLPVCFWVQSLRSSRNHRGSERVPATETPVQVSRHEVLPSWSFPALPR